MVFLPKKGGTSPTDPHDHRNVESEARESDDASMLPPGYRRWWCRYDPVCDFDSGLDQGRVWLEVIPRVYGRPLGR